MPTPEDQPIARDRVLDMAHKEWDRQAAPTAQAVKVVAGGAPPLTPEGQDAIDWGQFAYDVLITDSTSDVPIARFEYGSMAVDWARQHYPNRHTLRAVHAHPASVSEGQPSAASAASAPEGISDAMLDAACAAYFGAADRPLARQREWMRQAITAALAVAAPTPPEGTSAARPAEPRANVMFDNHTFQTGSLSEIRDWIAESYDEDLRGACMLTVRWDDRGLALLQDHARYHETKSDLRSRWLAAIDRLKAEIVATPPAAETPRQRAMALKIDVRCLRMVDDADARAMDRICRGIDELAALAEGPAA